MWIGIVLALVLPALWIYSAYWISTHPREEYWCDGCKRFSPNEQVCPYCDETGTGPGRR